MKQVRKERQGSRQIRRHEKKSRTPAQHLIDSRALEKAQEMQLKEENPFALRTEIRELENRFGHHRQALIKAEEADALAPCGPSYATLRQCRTRGK